MIHKAIVLTLATIFLCYDLLDHIDKRKTYCSGHIQSLYSSVSFSANNEYSSRWNQDNNPEVTNNPPKDPKRA